MQLGLRVSGCMIGDVVEITSNGMWYNTASVFQIITLST